jgi:hypothetical protein
MTFARCPFCNWPESDTGYSHKRRRYECPTCGGSGPRGATKELALKAWRQRPGEEDLQLRLTSAKAELVLRTPLTDEETPRF